MDKILIAASTHWDREWYRTFQEFQIRLCGGKAQPLADHIGHTGLLQHQGHLGEDRRRQVGDHIFRWDVAEQRDLLNDIIRNLAVGPADNHIGLDAQ